MSKKVYVITIFLALINFSLLSQNITPPRSLDIPKYEIGTIGKAITKPELTSYGFVVLIEGRLICSYSESGTLLWQSFIQGNPYPFISVCGNDFVCICTNDNTLHFYNPSGLLLWQVKLPYKIIEKPIIGKDGRIFVRGDNFLSCIGLNGIIRWTTPILESNVFPMHQLNDGSILCIQKKQINNCSTALRVSIYGEIIEEITFTGVISSITESENGIILGFTNNIIANCIVDFDTTDTYWKYQPKSLTQSPSFLFSIDNLIYVYSENGKIICLEVKNLLDITEKWIINLESYLSKSNKEIKDVYFDKGLLTLVFDEYACAIQTDGSIEWHASFPKEKGLLKFYTKQGHLIICYDNWILKAYRLFQPREIANLSSNFKKYEVPLKTKKTKLIFTDCENLLLHGNIGQKEKIYYPILYSFIQDFENSYLLDKKTRLKEILTVNLTNIEKNIYLTGLWGTSTFCPFLASVISQETDTTICLAALRAATQIGYDNNGQILNACEERIRISNNSDVIIINTLCDTVYAVCRFMGKPALFKKGKDLLIQLLSTKYDNRINDYARKTLEKIIKLEM